MDQRTALARNKRFRPTGLGLKTLGPAGIMKAVKRLPLIRGFREAPVIRLIKESGQFSPEFYRANYSDLAGYRGDLLLHFVRYGGYEGRSPNRHFDAKWYLNTNPGVERKGINPLYHFLKVGAVAGLWPSPDYDAREYLQLLENEGKGIE